MNDNIVGFPEGGRGRARSIDAEPRNAEREAELQQAAEKRLKTAPEIEARLRAGKTEKADRPVLALNLGRMWKRAFRDRTAPALSKLFEKAFGKHYGEIVNYKKRKRYIRFDGEDLPERVSDIRDGDFAAQGSDYAKLAVALARLLHEGETAERMEREKLRAILQVVEGTSLDRHLAPADRFRAEATAELVKRAEQMVGRVEREVELDWMREWIARNPVSAVIDAEGRIGRLVAAGTREEELQSSYEPAVFAALAKAHEGPRELWNAEKLEAWEARMLLLLHSQGANPDPVRIWERGLSLGDPAIDARESWSNLSPRVVLGYVYTRIDVDFGGIRFSTDEAAVEAKCERLQAVVDRAARACGDRAVSPRCDRDATRRYVLMTAVAKALAQAHGYETAEIENFSDLNSQIESDHYDPPRDPWQDAPGLVVLARRRVELQLRYDVLADRWRLCLALVHGVGDMCFRREGVYGTLGSTGFQGAHNLGQSDHPQMGSLFLAPVGKDRLAVFSIENEDYPADDFLGIGSGCLPFPSEAAVAAMLTDLNRYPPLDMFPRDPAENHRVELPLDAYWNRSAPAPAKTIAGMILRNLAYAPEAERYDRLLLEDARRKVALLKAFAQVWQDEYAGAIARLD